MDSHFSCCLAQRLQLTWVEGWSHPEAAGCHMTSSPSHSPADGGSQIHLNHILYKVGVGTRCGEGKKHPDDGPDAFCSFPWAEMVVEDL